MLAISCRSSTAALALALSVVITPSVALGDPGNRTVLAVLEFRNRLPSRSDAVFGGRYLSNLVRGNVLRTRKDIDVVTHENLIALLTASGKKMEDCEGECEVETGRQVGADLIITGEILMFGSKLKVDMRLHDTRSGRMIGAALASGESIDQLDAAMGPAIEELLRPIRPALPEKRSETHWDGVKQSGLVCVLAGAAAGGLSGYAYAKGKQQLDKVHDGGLASAADISGALSNSGTLRTVALASGATAAAAIVTGVILFFTGETVTTVAVAPTSGGAMISARFP